MVTRLLVLRRLASATCSHVDGLWSLYALFFFFFFNDTATTEIYTLSLHDALPISVTEKLMDELAQCYNVLPQLDINNTIDHRPEGDEKWFLENEKTVTQFCRKLAAERPLKDIRDEYNYPKKKGIKDECSRL